MIRIRTTLHRKTLLPLAVALGAAVLGCTARQGDPSRPTERTPKVAFVDVTGESGISFRHHSGAFGGKLMPETVGSGVAFLDYDGDGRLDLLFVDSSPWKGHRKPGDRTRPHLYRNLGGGRFAEIGRQAGLDFEFYGMGVAAADFDNDGDTDLFLTAIGPNRLLRNRGDGRFEDITRKAGVAGVAFPPGGLEWKWSSSASWLDYDRDGLLDLMVLNYVKWSLETDVWCGAPHLKAYCGPTAYEGLPNTLYRNLGNGRFLDVSREAGILEHVGKGFGIATADFDEDGWVDMAVANDTEPNFLFMNRPGKGKGNARVFSEEAVLAGIATGENGKAKAGMGIDCGDWRNEGRFGLLVGNFARECLTLARNMGEGRFEDSAYPAGMGQSSSLSLTFGAFFFDFDNDGWLDALAANGHIDDFINASDSAISYEQRPLIYRNDGEGNFREVGESLGQGPREPIVARGAAHGDFDDDGDEDVALVWNNRKGILWRNEGGNAKQWLGIGLRGTESNRDGIGALVTLEAGGTRQVKLRKSGGSFLSESDPRLHFGVGTATTADVTVRWPSGRTDRVDGLSTGRYHTITEGKGLTSVP